MRLFQYEQWKLILQILKVFQNFQKHPNRQIDDISRSSQMWFSFMEVIQDITSTYEDINNRKWPEIVGNRNCNMPWDSCKISLIPKTIEYIYQHQKLENKLNISCATLPTPHCYNMFNMEHWVNRSGHPKTSSHLLFHKITMKNNYWFRSICTWHIHAVGSTLLFHYFQPYCSKFWHELQMRMECTWWSCWILLYCSIIFGHFVSSFDMNNK